LRIKTETSVGLFILVAIGIFLYMSFQIGVFRFDTARYNRYSVFFHDISGLNTKANVQIAGVKVGWVEAVDLVSDGQQVRADVMVLKSYVLHTDAYGVIRQDGLLGTKYVELHPGDSRLPTIKPGGILMRASQDPVSIDQILVELQDISKNISDVTKSFKNVFGGDAGAARIEDMIGNFTKASDRVATFVTSLEGVVERNEHSFTDLVSDLRIVIGDLKQDLPNTTRELRDSINRASTAIDRDLGRLMTKFEDTTGPLSDVMTKINKGEGILGKLISDEDMGRDAKVAIDGVKKYFSKIDKLGVVFDVRGEGMYGIGDHMCREDGKGYIDVRVHPTEDYFYQLGLVGTYSGTVSRSNKYRQWFDGRGCPLNPADENLDPAHQLKYAPIKKTEKRKFDQTLYDIQFGKVFDCVAFRGGLFESSFGVALDIDIPMQSDNIRWVTSLEAFDFGGRNRINDDRIHMKWINKVFFANSLYAVFGADDFVSRNNKNAFFGMGLRFQDDDIKYYLSKVNIQS